MSKTEEFVKQVLAEATKEDIDELTNFLKGPLINLYLMPGPLIQSVHRIYMRTVFKNQDVYRQVLSAEIEEMQAAREAQTPTQGGEKEDIQLVDGVSVPLNSQDNEEE